MQVPHSVIKTHEEIGIIREGGANLSRVLGEIAVMAAPGATTEEIDKAAERRMREAGGEPSFLGFKNSASDRPYPTTLCTSINHEVVHAPASPSRTLKGGDVIGLDIGLRYKGYCTDMAVTVGIGKISKEAKRLIQVTRDALFRGLEAVRPGGFVGDIGRAVQTHVEKNGFSVVRDLVGHGIGRNVHEEPRIPNFYDPRAKPVPIQEGMVLCVEPMVNVGRFAVVTLPDGWTIATADGSLAAHFEVTLVVTKDGYEILTPLPV